MQIQDFTTAIVFLGQGAFINYAENVLRILDPHLLPLLPTSRISLAITLLNLSPPLLSTWFMDAPLSNIYHKITNTLKYQCCQRSVSDSLPTIYRVRKNDTISKTSSFLHLSMKSHAIFLKKLSLYTAVQTETEVYTYLCCRGKVRGPTFKFKFVHLT